MLAAKIYGLTIHIHENNMSVQIYQSEADEPIVNLIKTTSEDGSIVYCATSKYGDDSQTEQINDDIVRSSTDGSGKNKGEKALLQLG
jgi:hypothetical protein